jgi:hypothetical protein
LNQLKPYRFNFKTDADKTVDGFFAHEVSDIVPEAITGEKDAVDDDGNPIYQGIDQSKIICVNPSISPFYLYYFHWIILHKTDIPCRLV